MRVVRQRPLFPAVPRTNVHGKGTAAEMAEPLGGCLSCPVSG
jgi:hypothetical protein